MDCGTGIYIAVPEDIAVKILHEGYRCTRRGRVPAHRKREGAVRAFRRNHRSRPPVLLQARVPPGVSTTPHKDGIKLETKQLAPMYLSTDVRAHTTSPDSSSTLPVPYQPTTRAASVFPSPPGPSVSGASNADRARRLQQCRPTTLYRCTAVTNANSILRQKQFRAGNRGFIGPGIYVSRAPYYAKRYCQCRTPCPRVVLQCEVKLGNIKKAFKGHQGTGWELLAEGCDLYEEMDRDSLMLPDNRDGQIDMESVHTVYE